ncbi:hypothetical protein NA57DRAFT_40367 [Rhizodiscina lignyota]|uniref:Heterokaryon incompatibility domain-containing protein n=1 Tax=Rhizodiscina lignyota TaxID=1504668 RepID=A0A9P4IA08_9PEZI|nr:hypothetical protein NA57DRAFT_40367 [Rhizodiscina lignyota]
MTTPDTSDLREPLPSQQNGDSSTAGDIIATASIAVDECVCKIPPSALLRMLHGVGVATKTPEGIIELVAAWILSRRVTGFHTPDNDQIDADVSFPLSKWIDTIDSSHLRESDDFLSLASMAIGVAFLRESCRQDHHVTDAELEIVWQLIFKALTSTHLSQPFYTASRSAQGFLSVALCSLVKENGDIDELYRLHVWLPDEKRGSHEFAVHSHQPFAQSWILAGEGKDHAYKVQRNVDSEVATHAEYELAWEIGRNLPGTTYSADHKYSVVKNTGRLVHTTELGSAAHTRDMTYTIDANCFHTTEVAPDAFHATLFFFDSHRGFVKDAGVLGPKNGDSNVVVRDSAGVTPADLASAANAVRSWEKYMERGRRYGRRSELEHEFREFNNALNECDAIESVPHATRYRHLVLGELGYLNRKFGKYEVAKDQLEEAIRGLDGTVEQVEVRGELGVVYRHMNRLEDARRAFQTQYDKARQINNDLATCRAIGNLGMVNYQLSQQNHDGQLLELAIQQQFERIREARRIQETMEVRTTDQRKKAQWTKQVSSWESIGLDRLSLCYTAQGNTKEAVKICLQSQKITCRSEDPTVIAFSRFFFGRALLHDGQCEEALKQFNSSDRCTPAIALCKEPSEEHRRYLKELVDAGANLDLTDENSYTALDYAVFNGDSAAEQIVLEGLHQKLEGDVGRKIVESQREARLRKAYRELFQEKMRPVLLRGGGHKTQENLRRVYDNALAEDKGKREMFDQLKFVRYSNFLNFGRLPRSSDGLAQPLMTGPQGCYGEASVDFVIFFSYRWINKEGGISLPDDMMNTQYHRMVAATEEFLRLHGRTDRDKLGIWMDYACVNQDEPASGVAALPMILAQCDAIISLVDDIFYSRAWCCVESIIAQTLKKSYNEHLWYEHVPIQLDESGIGGGGRWGLREGPTDFQIVMAEKDLTKEEEDRPKVLFLERQSRLLG